MEADQKFMKGSKQAVLSTPLEPFRNQTKSKLMFLGYYHSYTNFKKGSSKLEKKENKQKRKILNKLDPEKQKHPFLLTCAADCCFSEMLYVPQILIRNPQ